MSDRAAFAGEKTDRWYAAYTRPSHEKVVAEHLKLRGISHYLPLYRSIRQWRNRCRVELQLPLFPNYVFVRIDANARVRVLEVPSIISVVSRGRIPEPLADADIEALQRGLDECRAEPYPYLVVGEKARIRSGPLAGMTGVIVRKKSGLRVVLTIEQIMKSVAVEVDGADLELIPSGKVVS